MRPIPDPTSKKLNVTPGKLYRMKQDLWHKYGMIEGKVLLVTKVNVDGRWAHISFLVGKEDVNVPFSVAHGASIIDWVDEFLEEYK